MLCAAAELYAAHESDLAALGRVSSKIIPLRQRFDRIRLLISQCMPFNQPI